MRRLLLTLVAFAALPALPPPAGAQDDLASVPRITLVELKKLQASGSVTVVDVRDASSFRAGHIPGAIFIPPEQVPASAGRLKNAKKPVVTYCA